MLFCRERSIYQNYQENVQCHVHVYIWNWKGYEMHVLQHVHVCENVECSLQIICSWAKRKADTLSPQHSVHCTWWLSWHCAFHHCVGLWAGWGQVPCSVDGSGGQPPRGVPHSHLPVLPGQRSTLWQCVWNHYTRLQSLCPMCKQEHSFLLLTTIQITEPWLPSHCHSTWRLSII